MRQELVHKFDGLSLLICDQLDRVLSRFDLSKSEIPSKLAKEFLLALATEFGHTSLETHRQNFRCIRKLISMLVETGLNKTLPLPATTAVDVHRWLANSGLAGSTAQSHQQVILAILKWCARNSDGLLSKRVSFVVPLFRRQESKERARLDEQDVRAILAACYKEIEEVESRRALGDRLLSGVARSPTEQTLANLIGDLLILGNGRIPGQIAINHARQNLRRRVQDAGGISSIRDLLYVDPRSMFPFYLAVICQTGGNPSPIAHMHTDCVSLHPIRNDVEVLTWEKKRANAEQKDQFPRGKHWSAPSLVRRYLALTEDMRIARAEGYHSENLFIALPHKGALNPTVPCAQLMHMMLDDFIEKHGLKNFDFKDLRSYVATAHRQATGTVLTAKRKLKHRSAATTLAYLSPSEVNPEHDQYIHAYQGQLVSLADPPPDANSERETAQPAYRNEKRAETVFGFGCADPFAGLGNYSPVGTLCTNFTKCSTCPGAIVPVDDPSIVANLLAAKQALDAAKTRSLKEGWVARFNALYEPTLDVLEREILPSISGEVQRLALAAVQVKTIPYLE